MKIGLMIAWNTDDASVHSGALARAWMQIGHKVIVFNFVQRFG